MDACKTSAQMRRHLQNPTIVTASQIIFTNTIRPLSLSFSVVNDRPLSLNQLQLHWHTSLYRFQWFISHWRWWCWWTSTRWGTKAPGRSTRGSRSRMQGRSWWYGLVGGKGSKLHWTEASRGYRIYQTGESLLFAANWGSFQTLTPLDCLLKLYHTKVAFKSSTVPFGKINCLNPGVLYLH